MKNLAFLALLAAPVAFATDPAHGGDHDAPQHGDSHGGDHGDSHGGDHGDTHGGDHGDTHGGDHGHHDVDDTYFGDVDGDGTPNWRDLSWDGRELQGFGDLWAVFSDSEDPQILTTIGFHALNVLILLGLLWRFAARPVSDALKNRALSIRKDLNEAARARDEARQKNEELAARLQRFEKELAQMKADAAEEAKSDADALVARAKAEAERIREGAERSIGEEVRRAKASLRSEAVQIAVQLAETTLSKEVQADDQRRLARQFLDSLSGDTASEGARG